MKCPVCNKQMNICTLDIGDSMETVWKSIIPCDCVCSYGASKAVWQELIRTRKALDVALDALNTIKGKYDPRCAVYYIDEKTAYDALEQITALEQKDVK